MPPGICDLFAILSCEDALAPEHMVPSMIPLLEKLTTLIPIVAADALERFGWIVGLHGPPPMLPHLIILGR